MKLTNLINTPHLYTTFLGKDEDLQQSITTTLKNYTIARMEQVHGNDYQVVTNIEKDITIPKVDALITTQKQIALVVKSADCLPILLYWQPKELEFVVVSCKRKIINHKKNQEKDLPIISAIHAGRRGTEKQITAKVVSYLKQRYDIGKKLGTLHVWLGPAICFDCYQINKKTNLHFDLVKKNIKQLKQLLPEYKLNIINSNHCTYHENNNFYSYRQTGKGVKMNYSIIALN